MQLKNTPQKQLKNITYIFNLLWTVVFIGAYSWGVITHRNDNLKLAEKEAEASFNKDLVYRRWAAQHGGVYALITDNTPPNSLLEHIPERDITTPSGKKLTLINPAYMTRQVFELAEKQYRVRGHITSLTPIRPENMPDEWEKEALTKFNKGREEISSIQLIEGKPYLRYMKRLITEKSCLKCHAVQGYLEGDIRGGISTSVPLSDYYAIDSKFRLSFFLLLFTIWLFGILLFNMGGRLLSRQIKAKEKVVEQLYVQRKISDKSQKIAHLGSWHLDIKKNILTWSDEQYRIFGQNPQEFGATYEAFLDTIHPDDKDIVNEIYTNAIKKNLPYECIHRIIRNDGEVRIVIEKSEDVVDQEGNVIHSFGFTQDITDRVQSENRYKNTIEISIDGFWVSDTRGKIIEANEAYCTMSGYSKDELLNISIIDIEVGHSEAEVEQKIQEIIKQGSARFESAHRKKDGKIFFVDVSTTYSPDNNGLFYTFIRDITDRKRAEEELAQSEERFRFHFENVPMPYQSLDNDGLFLDVNPAWLETLGYSRDEVIGKSFGDFLLPEMEEHFKYSFQRFKDKGEVLGVEFEMIKKDGSVMMARFNGKISYDIDGNFKQTHYLFQDITEFLKAEEEKKDLEARLQQAQKMEAIGTLAGGIAHDFNNILGAILGYTEMIQEDCPTGSTMRNDIDRVVEASHRAKDLVKQILAFSRQTEAEQMPLQPALIIKEAVKMLRSSLPTTIGIQQKIDPEAGLILADPTQIHQIITNLCTNAFHAMEETGGTLNISLKNKLVSSADLVTEPHLQPGLFVEISVGDTGPGIEPEIMGKIFDPFFTTKEIGKGTGMGLSIIHGIAKKSGGFVSCKSSPGKGAAFYVYLPVYVGTVSPKAETTPSELIQTGSERILFIDDEEILAEMGKTMLERLGYRVTVVTNSIEALRIIQSQSDRFDLIITDQTMPGMTGSDLARRLLQIRPGLPIILCTGFSNLISEEKARIYGIKGFAMKPLAKKDLATLIRKVLDEEK